MDDRFSLDRLGEMRGAPVFDTNGDQIGKVEEIFLDDQSQQPEFIGIGTGFFGTKRVLVPVQGAQASQEGVRVPFEKDLVKDSPDIDAEHITPETEHELYQYYGIGYSQGEPQTQQREVPAEDQALTRSEEELQVGKRAVDAGSIRLRKWVETEPVAMDVDLQRETARVTRERIDQPVDEHEFSEESVEMPLHAEAPVVAKQTVAKERIGLEKDVQTERQTVQDEVRKEHIEIEGADDAV